MTSLVRSGAGAPKDDTCPAVRPGRMKPGLCHERDKVPKERPMHRIPWLASAVLLLIVNPPAVAQHFPYKTHLKHPDSWFAGAEAKTIAANVLSHQSPLGGWPKNIDTGAAPYQGDPKAIRGTFDN